MFLFIAKKQKETMLFLGNFNTSNVFLSKVMKNYVDCLKDFNTSNVFIYPSLSSVLYLFFYISIHLMFLFIIFLIPLAQIPV